MISQAIGTVMTKASTTNFRKPLDNMMEMDPAVAPSTFLTPIFFVFCEVV